MTAMDLFDLTWRKSSRSNQNGGACVEIGFPKWRKSSRSNQNGYGCVEVAFAPELVGVRDSKNADGPALVFPGRSWASFLSVHKRQS
mgnify:CR=1 FL=1